MIVSVHVPKTAGTAFGESLKVKLGDRLFSDYGDWAGYNSAEAIAHRAVRAEEIRGRRDELLANYDAIHGHFTADKYADLFPRTDFVAFFRDPYQQTLSNYHYLVNNPQLKDLHPAVKVFHEAKMSIIDYLNWEDVTNPQSAFVGSLPLEAFAVIGLTEEYPLSVALFNRVFGLDLASDIVSNVNPDRKERNYEMSEDLRAAIMRSREADIELYCRAREIFASRVREFQAGI